MAKRVLVVEDDTVLRRIITRVLDLGGYDGVSAVAPTEALERVQAGEHFDLVMVDQRMPTMRGDQLIRALWDMRPGQAVMRLLGNEDDEVTWPVDAACPALGKPFGAHELLTAVTDCIGPP